MGKIETGFVLEENEVRVWRIALDALAEERTGLAAILSADERQRAERFRFAKDRNQYIISHGILRKALSKYLKCDPNGIVFAANEFGKPYLENARLKFNLSHSENIALIAITNEVEVGVDVEAINRKVEYLDLAERFFSQDEFEAIAAYPEKSLPHAFFRCWTSKEAIIKAKGEGLSIPLDSFSVSLNSDGIQKIDLSSKERGSSTWMLAPIEVNESCLASLAYEDKGGEKNIIVRDWPEIHSCI